jgi:hypothetical protein
LFKTKKARKKMTMIRVEWRFCNIAQRARGFSRVIGANWHAIYAREAAWFDSSDGLGVRFSLTISNRSSTQLAAASSGSLDVDVVKQSMI